MKMHTSFRFVVWMHLAILAGQSPASAATGFFTNLLGGNFLTAANWSPNVVPGAADSASFTNNATYQVAWTASRTNLSASFNAASGTVTQAIGASFWLLTNSYTVGVGVASTAAVVHTSGSLRVTNSARSAFIVIGNSGRGSYQMTGPSTSILADYLLLGVFSSSAATNQMHILGGAQASAGYIYIGDGSSDNLVRVHGSGSLLQSRSNLLEDFTLGDQGANNRLVVTNAGRVVSHRARLGATVNSMGNSAQVIGTGSVWSNSESIRIGDVGQGNRLNIENGGLISSSYLYAGFFASTSNNTVVVSGAATRLTVSNTLAIGYSSRNNSLLISNQAAISSEWGTIGTFAGSNSVTVTGTNSSWKLPATSLFIIGQSGSSNRMLVLGGASVTNGGFLYVGRFAGSNNLHLSGAGTAWTNGGNSLVGEESARNSITISNGAVFVAGATTIGWKTNADANSVIVAGGNSLWTNNSSLTIGSAGKSNALLVSAGGRVASPGGTVGGDANATGNSAWVTGSGSVWSNRSSLTIGNSGSFNQLVISNGGTVFASSLSIGFSPSTVSNEVTVSDGTLAGIGASGALTNLMVGAFGGGRLNFNGGTILAHRLVATNNGPGIANSIFKFNHGTLTTLSGAAITQTPGFEIGTTPSQTATWNIMGGTNALICGGTALGASSLAARGVVVATGPSTVWSNSSSLFVGDAASSCLLVVSNGARVYNASANIGRNRTNNQAWVTGAGSVWTNNGNLSLGTFGAGNLLVVSNGGTVFSQAAFIGDNVAATNNLALITGTNSTWRSSSINLGNNGNRNSVVISGAGMVLAPFLTVGVNASSTNNTLSVNGGSLLVTNAGRTARFDIRRGTNRLNAGLIEADRLLVTNALGAFVFNGGTLISHGISNNNGRVFGVGIGNGAGPAILNLAGAGVHFFGDGLSINASGSLIGNGTVVGDVTIQPLGTLSPGASVGRLVFSNSPALNGNTVMEISRDGSTLTNDQMQIAAPLTYGGTLTIAKIGPTSLSAGNQFPLFIASSYGGVFSSLTLPALDAGLMWVNELLVNGSIQVVPFTPPHITHVALAGTNLVMSGSGGPPGGTYHVLTATNIALPLAGWTSILTNQFDWLGSFALTNAVHVEEPQRFYALRVP